MRQTACARRSLAGMIGGGTWEGAPMPGIRRREFVTLLGGAAVAWPFAARAQQAGKLPTIGFFSPNTRSAAGPCTAAFVERLREVGWIEGRTIAIEYRWGEGRGDRIPGGSVTRGAGVPDVSLQARAQRDRLYRRPEREY